MPSALDAPPEVVRAAECLAEHPDELEQVIARSRQAPPFQFEYGGGSMICEDFLVEPEQ